MRKSTLKGSRWLAAAIVFSTLLGGCGSAKHPLVQVKGRVVFEDGQPLPAGTRIILEPVEPGRMPAVGELSSDGTFELKHTSGSRGAEIGKYRVRIAAPPGDAGSFFRLVPESYAEGNELLLEVKPNLGEVVWKVRRKNPV